MTIKTLCASLAIAMAATLMVPYTADAGRYRGTDGLDEGYVTAFSRFGNGKISAPVRPTRLGPQVRIPSGYWAYCRRSCSETLRVKTVDKDAHQNGNILPGSDFARECGVFGCLDLGVR